jgi:hypothetical protein
VEAGVQLADLSVQALGRKKKLAESALEFLIHKAHIIKGLGDTQDYQGHPL